MIRFILSSALTLTISASFAQEKSFTLDDYLEYNAALDLKVDSVFKTLDEGGIVAQLIMPAVGKYGSPEDSIVNLIKQNKIGGVLLLNGTKSEFKGWTNKFEGLNEKYNHLPFLYSADAEPSLFNRKMRESAPVKKAVEINSMEDIYAAAHIISDELNEVGVNYNFAPVVDVSSNKTVGYRSL